MGFGMDTLVIHTGGIGDFLLACPSLAHCAPPDQLDLLGRKDRLQLAVAGKRARRAYDLDEADFHTIFNKPGPRLRAFLQPYEKAVVWMRDTGEIAAGLTRCGLSEVRCFSGLPPRDWTRHASDYYLNCLGAPPAPPFRLALPPVNESHDVIIHPGSGGSHKNWPLENFIALAEALETAGRCIAWALGPAEEDIALPAMAHRIFFTDLTDFACALQNTALYIGNDSGITHLAATSGCRVIAIFGPTDPDIWAPIGEQVMVIKGHPWPTVQNLLQMLSSNGVRVITSER